MSTIKGIDVKIWMMKQALKNRDIAKGYGCGDMVVSNFIRGNGHQKACGILH